MDVNFLWMAYSLVSGSLVLNCVNAKLNAICYLFHARLIWKTS
jgi:hypothetical protein